MKLSALQKYILKQCIQARDTSISKTTLDHFYRGVSKPPSVKDQINGITKSVERLITKELVIAHGWKTKYKWFITNVKLTPKGRAVAKSLLGIQQKLPLKK